MQDERIVRPRTSHLFPPVPIREVTDENLAREILEYADRHPGTGEWQMAQAMRVPLRQVYDVTRELERGGELARSAASPAAGGR